MGRPKKDISKDSALIIRIDKQEKKQLKEYAALNRMSVSDYVRDALNIRDQITRNTLGLSEPEHEYFEEEWPEDEEIYED